MLHVLRSHAVDGPVIGNSQALIDYLFLDMAHLPTERLRVLFLNSKNRLLGDEILSEGSIDEIPLYPREILRRALEVGATALILVHNHPSGDPHPSAEDVRATKRLQEACRALGVSIHDHLIVARTGCWSFKAAALLRPSGAPS
jgi:DNA repair protein RadC